MIDAVGVNVCVPDASYCLSSKEITVNSSLIIIRPLFRSVRMTFYNQREHFEKRNKFDAM